MKKGAAFRRVSISKWCSWSHTQLSELAWPGPPPLIRIGGDMFMSFCNQTSRWRARAGLNGANHHQFPLLFKRWNDLRLSHHFGEKKTIKNLFLHTCIYDQGDYSPLNGDLCVLHDIEERKNLMNVADRWGGGGRLKPSEFKQILTLATLCPRPHCRWPRMHAFYRHLTASNSAQRITLRGTIVAALLLYRRARTHCF